MTVLKIRFHQIALPILLILSGIPQLVAGGPWYQFEMIIFERIAKGAGSTEFWPEDPGIPSRVNAIQLPTQASGSNKLAAYKPLPKSARKLNAHWQRLRNSRNYRPHVHVAWRQQVTSPERAQRLYLELPQKNAPAKFEGTIKVGVKRYLHLETDLLFRRPLKRGATSESQTGMLSFGPDYRPYRAQSLRRMRSGKLHYIDHPIIGILFLATRYQAPTAAKPVEPAPAASSMDEAAAPAETPTATQPSSQQ
jgi:hypothetical protein